MTKILTVLFSILLILLVGRLWMGSGSFPQIWHMQEQIDVLSTSNKQKQEGNRKLEAEIQEFQKGTEAIEARARNDFGMTKKGEAYYHIILSPKNVQPTEPPIESKPIDDASSSTSVESTSPNE